MFAKKSFSNESQIWHANAPNCTLDPSIVNQKSIILQMVTRNLTHVMLGLPSSYGTIYVYTGRVEFPVYVLLKKGIAIIHK